MQADQLKQRIDQIEDCTDEAKRALSAGPVPPDLRQCVEQMHEQARQVQQVCATGQAQQMEQGLREKVAQLEQTGDRAMLACRQAGGGVDPRAQQAVQRAHDEISNLKKQMA